MGPMLILHSMTGAMAHGEGGGGGRNRDMITLLKFNYHVALFEI